MEPVKPRSDEVDEQSLGQFFKDIGPPPDDPRSHKLPKGARTGTILIVIAFVATHIAIRVIRALGH